MLLCRNISLRSANSMYNSQESKNLRKTHIAEGFKLFNIKFLLPKYSHVVLNPQFFVGRVKLQGLSKCC